MAVHADPATDRDRGNDSGLFFLASPIERGESATIDAHRYEASSVTDPWKKKAERRIGVAWLQRIIKNHTSELARMVTETPHQKIFGGPHTSFVR